MRIFEVTGPEQGGVYYIWAREGNVKRIFSTAKTKEEADARAAEYQSHIAQPHE